MKPTIDQFINAMTQSLANGTFVKLTLANYKGSDETLQKVFVRPVDTKNGARLLFQFRGRTNDQVKNFEFGKAAIQIQTYLQNGFRSAHLFTTENDLQLTIGKRSARLTTGKPTFNKAEVKPHDREKRHRVDPNAYYLKALGITTEMQKPDRKGGLYAPQDSAQSTGTKSADAIIRADQRDKWKQINKFVEILSGLYDNSDLKKKPTLNIVDMGSGKGYLTFAAYDYFSYRNASVNERGDRARGDESISSPPSKGGAELPSGGSGVVNGRPASGNPGTTLTVTGIESRPHLVNLCNQIAQAGAYDGLKFIRSTIADFDPGEVDILIALHACDTATDDALYKGIAANASIIVAAPCCHKEVKKQLRSPELLSGILKHPVMLERTAEMITDGLRSMLLEREGYKTKMFEFVATEHTPKNNMLVATKRQRSIEQGRIDEQIEEIQNTFGIEHQHLADALKRRK